MWFVTGYQLRRGKSKTAGFISLAAVSLFAAIAVAAVLWHAVPAAAASPASGNCRQVSIAVSLAEGRPADQRLAATYCTPALWAAGAHTADVLVPGGSYNRSYYDFPVAYPQYSFVDKTLRAGRATLAIDRIGTGASSHPFSSTVTLQSDAYTVHQAVQWAAVSGGNAKVNIVAHSLGSVVALQEASQYSDTTHVAITGLTHRLGSGFALLGASAYPAALDSQFAGKGYDPDYVTTRPGTRQQLFYNATANPAVIAYDEAHKDIFAAGLAGEAVAQLQVPAGVNASNRIHAAVLVLLGQQDFLFCTAGGTDCSSDAAFKNQEAPYYTSARLYDAQLIPNTAHDLALHPTVDDSFGRINNWFAR